ncbi:MAG: hypothetical protein HYV62_14160 [Candidatus Rokubacteria bacterium]|nr:hypothetical protein [Candidatus Rokubacteria bacterium]
MPAETAPGVASPSMPNDDTIVSPLGHRERRVWPLGVRGRSEVGFTHEGRYWTVQQQGLDLLPRELGITVDA